MKRRILAASLAIVFLLGTLVTPALAGDGEVLVRIRLADPAADVVRLAAAPLTPLARESAPQDYVLARAGKDGLDWLATNRLEFDVLDTAASFARYLMIDLTGPKTDAPEGRLLFADGQRALWRVEANAELPSGHNAWFIDQPIRLLPRPLAPLPDSITPLPIVQEIIDQVDLTRLMFNTNELSGQQATTINGQPYTITTRNTLSGTPVNQSVAYMVERLQRLGLAVTTHTWNASRPPNVIAEKPGLNPSAGIVIICGHLDDMPSSGLAPGADDNGSGSIAVLQAAEILAPYNFDATLRFVLFTGEEQGLLGSAAYAQLVQSQDIRGVLNMDMIAWDNVGGPNMDLHANSSVAGSVALAQVFADVVSAYDLTLTPAVYSNGTSASDHASFWNVGIPAFLVIENYRSDGAVPADFNAWYHTSSDRTQYFNQTYFNEMTKASVATFAHMAGIRTNCYWADLDCSGQVTVADTMKVTTHWLASLGQWNYSRVYDANDDTIIDATDLQLFAAEWGLTNP